MVHVYVNPIRGATLVKLIHSEILVSYCIREKHNSSSSWILFFVQHLSVQLLGEGKEKRTVKASSGLKPKYVQQARKY